LGTQLILRANPIRPGDSGGTQDGFWDPRGPVIGVNSEFNAGSNRQPFLWQHNPGDGGMSVRNIDWLWSILDPAGSCSYGSAGPCDPSRYPGSFPDTDGDGLPDVRDLCPTVALTP